MQVLKTILIIYCRFECDQWLVLNALKLNGESRDHVSHRYRLETHGLGVVDGLVLDGREVAYMIRKGTRELVELDVA